MSNSAIDIFAKATADCEQLRPLVAEFHAMIESADDSEHARAARIAFAEANVESTDRFCQSLEALLDDLKRFRNLLWACTHRPGNGANTSGKGATS